jgi:hypothetical protein
MSETKTVGNRLIHPVIEERSVNSDYVLTSTGMTLRQYFIGQALAGSSVMLNDTPERFVAQWAIEVADSVIKLLDEEAG